MVLTEKLLILGVLISCASAISENAHAIVPPKLGNCETKFIRIVNGPNDVTDVANGCAANTPPGAPCKADDGSKGVCAETKPNFNGPLIPTAPPFPIGCHCTVPLIAQNQDTAITPANGSLGE